MLSIHRTGFLPLKIGKNQRRDPFDNQGALFTFHCDSGSESVKNIGGHGQFECPRVPVRNDKSCLCFNDCYIGTIQAVVVWERIKLSLFVNNKSCLAFFFTFVAVNVVSSGAAHGADGATDIKRVLHLDTRAAFCGLTQ